MASRRARGARPSRAARRARAAGRSRAALVQALVPAQDHDLLARRRASSSSPSVPRARAAPERGRRAAARTATRRCRPWRRTPLRRRRSRIGASSTGSASSTSTAWANSRSRHLRLQLGSPSARCSSSGSVPAARESMCGEPRPRATGARAGGPPRWWPRRRRSRRVARPRAREPAAASASARSQGTARSSPPSRSSGSVMRSSTWKRLVGEAAPVAQPAVVDLGVLAGQHAHHALVAHGQRDVALRRAQRAHRARVLDVPRARPEAVGARGQRADRAQLDDVAAERRHVGVPVEGRRRRSARRARAAPAGSPRRSPGRSARSGSRGCSARGRSRSAARARAA